MDGGTGDTRALEEEIRKLRVATEELNEVLTRSKGEIALRGLISSLVAFPVLGATIYVSARLALRRTSPPR